MDSTAFGDQENDHDRESSNGKHDERLPFLQPRLGRSHRGIVGFPRRVGFGNENVRPGPNDILECILECIAPGHGIKR